MVNTWTLAVLGFINMPGTWEMLLILLVALLLFGRRLPEVARSMGKSIVEFKKGMQDVQRNIESEPPADEAETKQSALTDKPVEGEQTKS